MRLAKVLGTVVAAQKHEAYQDLRIMLCQPVDFDGKQYGKQVVAVDQVQAGPGELVLLLTEGTGVRQILQKVDVPIRTLIVGVVDDVNLAHGEA